MMNIYAYKEFHIFLRDAWQEKKGKNPAFSLTSWAHQLGLENCAPLSLTLKGKRTLPKKYLPQIMQSLGLSEKEGYYLETLGDLAKAKKPEQKLFYINKLSQLSPQKELQWSVVDEYKFLSDPLHSTILEMTALKGFRLDINWIQPRIRMKYKKFEISEAIERLKNLQFLSVDPQTKAVKKSYVNLTSKNDVTDLASQNYHNAICKLAGHQVSRQSVQEREYGSYTFNIDSPKNLKRAKERIREFITNFFTEFESPEGEGTHTYQLSFQLFQMAGQMSNGEEK